MAGPPVPWHFWMMMIGLALQGPSQSMGYNIDASPAATFTSISKQFGYQVLQIGEGPEARIVVGAPGEQNSTGKVYQCDMQKAACEAIPLAGSNGVPHLGLTLASDNQGSKMIACAPGVEQHCDKNLYVSGVCYLLDAKLHNTQNITTGYQKCLKGNLDLVFLFDGSESMRNEDFNTIKDFMIKVMEELRNSTIHFAAVQFSEDAKIEFDFNDYTKDRNPRKLLANVKHMKSITDTFKAIKHVANDLFTPERGMREGANKVIILITDGDATDDDLGSIAAARKKEILRLVIGIGIHLTRDNLEKLASEPHSEFVKILASFEELKDSFDDLQSKIYGIEGASDKSSFHLEMSSSGFSADISQDRVVLGAVGADNWAGGLLEQQKDLSKEQFISTPSLRKEMEGAYLGYALKFLQHQQRELYAAGAPRYQHLGRVFIFEVNVTTNNWTLKQEIEGQQTGSYFGGVLCTLDVDSDQETDFLLIGAPFHFTETEGGCVYVYGWEEDRLVLLGELKGDPGYPLGRFGAAISDLKDISGDGLMDVAVGAPLEDEEKGAVYIYNGHQQKLPMHYSQRITGTSISPGLQFFGQSIHGKTDLNKDGLIDITVGALGEVVVLRSRPIVTVVPQVTFLHTEIPVEEVECLGDAAQWRNKEFGLNVCFNIRLATQSYQGPLSVILSFHLEIDSNRMKNRGVFRNGKRTTNGIQKTTLGQMCVQETINITNCIEDYISPIKLFVNFSLSSDEDHDESHPRPVQNSLSNTTTVEIPFSKNCGTDDKCVADMQISFHDSGSQELVISPKRYLNMNLELKNPRENAYYPTLHVLHMPGLSFRKASVLKASPPIIVNCDGMQLGHEHRGLSCNISHPIFRDNTEALIQLWFGILTESSWGNDLEMEVNVSSDNEENDTLHDNTARLQIPVKYPINIIVERLQASTQHVSFSSRRQENKTVIHSYNVTNWPMGTFPPPEVSVFVKVPTMGPDGLTWEVEGVQTDPSVFCQPILMERSANRPSEWIEMKCEVGKYRIYRCDLGQINSSIINVTGVMRAKSNIEHFPRSKFCTALWLMFNTTRYVNFYSQEFAQYQDTELEVIFEMNYLPIIIGSVVGGLFLLILIIVLLYKCGFFKRNYKAKMGDGLEENENALQLKDNVEEGTEKEAKSENDAESDKEKETDALAEPLNGEAEAK
nr:PREDICTED: integrin alpha-L isoform X2 [Anolis carolinensis]|eukprot:XP_008119196.1 PREDICTED: integrin alpha-L isoform X2 [Anolis carolinensis]